MRKSLTIIAVLVSGLVLGVLATGSAAPAADAKSVLQVFGTVDVEQAFNGYGKKKQLEQELVTYYDQAKAKLELRQGNKLLADAEFTELADLKIKPKPVEADTKRIEELTNLSKQREQEFQALQQKVSPSDAEKARLNELQAQIKKAEAALKDDETKYQDDLNKKRVELSQQVMLEVNTVVAAVAKEKGLAIVFNKSASEPSMIIYSNLDITEDVLKKLNKK
jgi:Skp family chaperone for outer membrane proteins